ncbi:hypothetical protein E3N88_01722 [Mikania micrantha]|uniref:Protein kinase domain-containing protein n=1 Tax=Mikania micrantha TaxID=192012 RepID=A0A5N6Q3D0_9ASTR|nr:hypothetical protein E3N88_01722 [Mikania micrantha]
MAALVVLFMLFLTNPVFSQSNDRYDNTNLFIATSCGNDAVISMPTFINNRNSTFNDLRMQLLSKRVFYARAQSLTGGDSVFTAVQCRNYLSVDQCVACFDDGVSQLVNSCTFGNGGFISYDNCFIRYEDYATFYNNPYVMEDKDLTPTFKCGNRSASQPTVFKQVVDRFLSDIRHATPKISNLYAASTRPITSENTTVYAMAQCVETIDPARCKTCMNTAYDILNDCLPNTEGRFLHLGCFARYSDTPFFNVNQTIDIASFIKGHSRKVAIIAEAVAGVVLVLLVLLVWLLYRSWKKSKKNDQDTTDFEGAIHYSYKDLQLATNNFSEENILGKGGFGEVFKGVLEDNQVVAVKKLKIQNTGVKDEFENEVKLISNVHHRNLLSLLGWSMEGSYLLLVLEYMANGSLDRFLWGSKKGTLNWNQRYEIIFGIARGLAHLHNEFHVKIVHRDIKSNNILLTDDFKPKIADFGLARFQPEDQSHVSTKFAGTLGYTAPEYALHGFLSEKVDTYSFGIVILEIISGRRSTEVKHDSQSTNYLLENWYQSGKTTKGSEISTGWQNRFPDRRSGNKDKSFVNDLDDNGEKFEEDYLNDYFKNLDEVISNEVGKLTSNSEEHRSESVVGSSMGKDPSVKGFEEDLNSSE